MDWRTELQRIGERHEGYSSQWDEVCRAVIEGLESYVQVYAFGHFFDEREKRLGYPTTVRPVPNT